MAIAVYYRFTPCCESEHPSFFQVPVTPLPDLPFVYNYTGPTVTDSLGYQLETGKCYFVEDVSTIELAWVASLFPTPEPNPVTLLPYTPISAACPPTPTIECPCVIPPNPNYSVYSLQPCCGGEPTTVYFINDSLVDGSTYIYGSSSPEGNLIVPSCYTATQIVYTGKGVPPFIQVLLNDFTIVETGCGEFGPQLTSVCELFCLECICARYIWTGIPSAGTYAIQYIDCTNQPKILNIPRDGVTWTDKICLKRVVSLCLSPDICWTSESFGNCTIDLSDPGDIKIDCPSCYELRDCTGDKASIYTLSSQVAQYIDTQQVIKIVGDDTCWRVYDSNDPCDCAVNVTVEYVYTDCPSCLSPKGYKLTECTTGNIIYTTTDLSNYIGATLEIDCPGCWEIEPIDIVPPTNQPVTVISSFDDCKTCNATFYELTDCRGILDPIVTITDLSLYVGKVVQLQFCPDTCWQVAETTPQEIDGEVIIDESFTTCPECLVAVLTPQCVTFTNTLDILVSLLYADITGRISKVDIKAKSTTSKTCAYFWDTVEGVVVTEYGDCVDGLCPVPVSPKRKVTPGYNTAVCSTEYYEKVECNFADWMYKDVLEKRYGISNCCPEELIKWEIKHEMLMLDVLVNPDYICSTGSTCNCPSSCDCGYISLTTQNGTCSS
jgi:hypothetical protein